MTTYNVDVSDMTQFLLGLLNIYSPTGDTERAVAYVRRAFDTLGLETALNAKGALIATFPNGTYESNAEDDKFWGIAQEADFPLGIHIGSFSESGLQPVMQQSTLSFLAGAGGSKSGGLVRVGVGADVGVTNSMGVTVGTELGQTRPRGVGGPSGVLFGLGLSYAFGRR